MAHPMRLLGLLCLSTLSMMRPATGQALTSVKQLEGRPRTPEKRACDPSIKYDVRWSSSSQRIYLEHTDGKRGGCATLTSVLKRLRQRTSATPLVRVRAGVWLLRSELYVKDGITLKLYGTKQSGGDVNELRFYSSDKEFYNLRGYGGNLDIKSTHIFGWDPATGRAREKHSGGRSYISCISEFRRNSGDCTKTGPEQGECRMDIVDSEIDHLGWADSESYGLTWKARGLCTNLSNLDLFDDIGVYGNLLRSNVHHLYYGMYSYGHQGGVFNYNKMHDNVRYGFDPHDDSDWLQFHFNEVWGNGDHNIITSKRCNHVSIQNNHVYDGENVGIFLHRSGDDSIIRGNYVHDNKDAGVALLESSRVRILKNTLVNNRFGVRLSVGSSDNYIAQNTIRGSRDYHFYTYQGNDEPLARRSGRPRNNRFVRNNISGRGDAALNLERSDGTRIKNNTFRGVKRMSFEESGRVTFRGNTLPGGVSFDVDDSCFTGVSNVKSAWKC